MTVDNQNLLVETSTVTKLIISGAARLDPVTVFLEDFGCRDCPTEKNPSYQTAQGKITISCWDKSWNAYWGGMGPRTVAEFVSDCDSSYILNCLSRGLDSRKFTGRSLEKLAAKCVIDRRRGRNLHRWENGRLDAEDARNLFNRIEELSPIESSNDCWQYSELLTELFGEEWHYPVGEGALEENHEYTYLLRVVEAVQKGMRQVANKAAA